MAGIEGLRAIAASSIVLVHVWMNSMPNGALLGNGTLIANILSMLSTGVTLFFCLSGFLLYRQFAAPIARGSQRLPIAAYFHNRVARIAPAYWFILIVTGLMLATVSVREPSGHLTIGRLTPFGFAQAALLLQQYHPGTVMSGIGPAWSLAVEVAFYVSLPLFALAITRFARHTADRRQRVLLLLAPPVFLLLLGLSGKAVAAFIAPASPLQGYNGNWHSVVERSIWGQADLFTFGMVVAVLHVEASDGRLSLPNHWRRMAVGLALLIFIPCAWTMHRGELSYLPQNTGEALALALILAAIVIPDGSHQRPSRAVRLLESPILVAVGLVSFSLFLWHYPLIYWLRDHGMTVAGGWGDLMINLVIVASVAGALSTLTYRYVELPALRRKRSTRVEKAPVSPPEAPEPAGLPLVVSGADAPVRTP